MKSNSKRSKTNAHPSIMSKRLKLAESISFNEVFNPISKLSIYIVVLIVTSSLNILIKRTLAQNDYAPIAYETQNPPYYNNSFQQQPQQQPLIQKNKDSQTIADQNDYQSSSACCPCDEAKYELIFEGLWSKYTHPDDFPESEMVAYFGDIIGASHSNEFRMWEPGTLASEGVKELAESGSTKRLESELKLSSMKTRTIIKARELRYPTLTSKTSAVFRTDRRHHLVSILSKLGPSPDWMVGVSGLNLCQQDCTWSTQKTVNLFLWDAGIDSGNNFTKSSNPTIPQDSIHAFRRFNTVYGQTTPSATSNSNNNYNNNNNNMYMDIQQAQQSQSNPTGSDYNSFNFDQMKPFARLTITRQRIYEKSCNHSDQPIPVVNGSPSTSSGKIYASSGTEPTSQQNQMQNLWQTIGSRTSTISPSVSDCRYTNWSDWTSCSSSCGKGIRTRTRTFKNDRFGQTTGCSSSGLVEKEICLAECRANSTCYTRDWGAWSRCSVDCGQGRRKRTRSIIGPRTIACESVDLAEEEPCIGMGDCSGGGAGNGEQSKSHHQNNPDGSDINCEVTSWSAWTECSRHPCGGTRIRTRQYLNRESVGVCKIQLIQKRQCPVNAEQCRHIFAEAAIVCNLAPEEGPCYGDITRWYYNNSTRSCNTFTFRGCAGNENNFDTLQDCEHSCLKPMKKLKSLQNNPT